QILNAQSEARKEENYINEDLHDGNESRHDLGNHQSSDQVCSFPTHERRRLIGKDDEAILKRSISRHGVPVLIIFDCDGRFASQFWWSLHKELVRNSQLTSLEIIHETIEKIVQIKSHIQAARDRHKNYAGPGPDARIPDHQDASGDADSHI
ncbi:hypothetical protein Tco_1198363, partial [Tanacetum coccineum]